MDQAPSAENGSNRSPNSRPTLGFLLASLHTGASLLIWPSLLDAAEHHDINLICFPGGRLQAADSFEVQRNAIFDLANDRCLDGLITWSSSLGGVVGPTQVRAFHERYRPLPMVSLAQFMEGMPTVSIDSYQGMRALLVHLIEGHGYRRLAFIRGPEEHYYAQERYRAYLDVLQAYNLPLVPELVTRPLPWESGVEAVQILLDERGLKPGRDFAAVVAVSDMMALWVLKSLQARGFKVPDDVAVTGFNNSIEERIATPPLTTVDLPFYQQGARALEILMQQKGGKPVPALITLPSKLIVRQSCGCPSAAIEQASFQPPENAGDARKRKKIRDIRADCINDMEVAANFDPEKGKEWLKSVFDAFVQAHEEISRQRPTGNFLSVLDDVLDQLKRSDSDVVHWQNVISTLRRWVLPLTSSTDRAGVEALLSQARVVVEEAVQRSHAYQEWQADRETERIREVNRALLTTFDIHQLADVLVDHLPGLGIPSVYLVIYDRPTDAEVPETARLILAFGEQKRSLLDKDGLLFSTDELLPSGYLPRHRRYSLVVEPLYFQDKTLGYVVFEIGNHNGNIYELLRYNLSSALQGAMLFQEIQQARLDAEKADRIKTRLLANVSHEMRTPLNIIIGYTQNMLMSPGSLGEIPPPAWMDDIRQIQSNAEHQLRVINDLLDLSRAEIDELDLSLEFLDPRQLFLDAFHSLADQSTSPNIEWEIKIPERLPQIRADRLRLRQIYLNLISNAKKYTEKGQITLGAEVVPPQIHFWVSDTGLGIDPEHQERIFEPFVTIEDNRRITGGIGLGLSITRHLVALHGGTMSLDSRPGKGSTFHIHLPLPSLDQTKSVQQDHSSQVLLLISSFDEPTREIIEMCRRQKLEILRLQSSENLDLVLGTTTPVALAWDLKNAQPSDWGIVRRLRHYPMLSQTPFILFGHAGQDQTQDPGLTGFLVKSSNTKSLLDAVMALCPVSGTGPVLIVDDDPHARLAHQVLVEDGLPGCSVLLAESGEKALEIMTEDTPVLVMLDLVMPGLSGADVLDQMRAHPVLRKVPVIILSNKNLTLEDVKRIEGYTQVTLQTKGVWTDAEIIAAMNRAIVGSESLPAHTSALVKQAVACLQKNYTRSVSRWEIAEAVGVSEDYLSRVFARELNISPWDYLNRYRVLQARHLLKDSSENIGAIARQVGFKDQAYFSRVFHKVVGVSPQAFRESVIAKQ